MIYPSNHVVCFDGAQGSPHGRNSWEQMEIMRLRRVSKELRCDRVRVWVDGNHIVVKIPTAG
ncbi:unnamed protein product [Arabis nemorensis]|uniref:Uncharacterized protein n=1 Tax=Arabis nemorensis TaxID=586526 RepID=A0A565BNP5_9BRAS|nr:unnamed protein product [Arabis nemorensis]